MANTDHLPTFPFRMTSSRKEILSVIEDSDVPMTAAQIYKTLRNSDRDLWLSTVYRSLELFVEHGIITREQIPITGESYYRIRGSKHLHYGVCTSCHKLFKVISCPLENYTPVLEDPEFRVLEHQFLLLGICSKCDSA